MSDLIERLRREYDPMNMRRFGLVNPDGPEAAEEIIRLTGDNKRLRAERDDLRGKLRNVISHATGGGDPGVNGADLSLNEIGVRISRHVSRVYAAGEEKGRTARQALGTP